MASKMYFHLHLLLFYIIVNQIYLCCGLLLRQRHFNILLVDLENCEDLFQLLSDIFYLKQLIND